jgi:hypothetical protein
MVLWLEMNEKKKRKKKKYNKANAKEPEDFTFH